MSFARLRYPERMITELSILIPTYNHACPGLVSELKRQAQAIRGLSYEIIVADDGSTLRTAMEENEAINAMEHCRYIVRESNQGRSAIRNFLASQAHFDHLLYIDSDMEVRSDDYLRTYAEADKADVVYGGYAINGERERLRGNLRYHYESEYKRNGSARKASKKPHGNFRTANFMVKRELMLRFPFDERFRKYGYEDLLWGKTIRKAGIAVCSIDNPLSFEHFETNADFVAKTEEGMATLCRFSDELRGYSAIIAHADRLEKLHLISLFAAIFGRTAAPLRRRLVDGKPSVLLFSIYKLGYYCKLRSESKA